MADKLLICLSATGATVARWNGKRITDCKLFGAGDEGVSAFREFLGDLSGVPVYFMVDTVEEDYRYETLPHTFGSDRADMVSRKLKQHYRNAPFAAAWLQGREEGKRRDDRYLLSALTNPELVTDWLQAVAERGLPVAGIYLLPMVSAAILEKLDTKSGNLLLVSQHSAGLRLTFFRNGQFRLSRLTRGESEGGARRAKFITDEISNTRLYLHAMRTTTLDEQVTVVLLDRNDQLDAAVGEVARDNPSLDCMRVGRQELSDRLGLPESLLDLSSDVIYLQLLGARVPPSNLASATVTRGFRQYQGRRAIYAGAAAIVLAAAVWSANNFWQMMDVETEAAAARKQAASLQAQYREVTRLFPKAPTSAENLRKAVEISQKLQRTLRTPEPMFRLVSEALEESPTIVVRELSWRYGVGVLDRSGSGTAAQEGTASPGVGSPGQQTQRRQSGLIEGEVRPFRGDFRAAIDSINAFADRLAKNPAVAEVRVVKLPLNVNPTLSLTGTTLESGAAPGNADFQLIIVLRPAA